ncbi:MAG: hypothetical protein G01um101425_466 [Candidatus Peregrinibacteria bacterium Gr01-1014_25]|nr:MAG: hypothetical protein G01um101425_466 [Candidatus Peregrinibacteria bacterium Gr01-1014_25]
MVPKFSVWLVAGSMLLSPLSAAAADVTAKDILRAIRSAQQPIGESVTLTASTWREVRPDYAEVQGACVIVGNTRREARNALKQAFRSLKKAVAEVSAETRGARVIRKEWWATPAGDGTFYGQMNIHVQLNGESAVALIEDVTDAFEDLEEADCTQSIARSLHRIDTKKVTKEALPDLIEALKQEKAEYEEDTDVRLGALLNTSVSVAFNAEDYDPEDGFAATEIVLSATFAVEQSGEPAPTEQPATE